MKYSFIGVFFLIAQLVFLPACSNKGDEEIGEALESERTPDGQGAGALHIPACRQSLYADPVQPFLADLRCRRASPSQIRKVNEGNQKKDRFLSRCYSETDSSCWCDQLVRPNPQSIELFFCTYGENQVHQLIHPNETTWKYAIEAVKIVEELENKDIYTQIIYNWWRPEPYNKNVGGSATRHPFGTSIDVRFATKQMQNQAFDELCKMRRQGRIRAIGYYSSTAIHFGVGDNKANTWGKSCP